jgi:CBS domain containing-hemolysin-like protein
LVFNTLEHVPDEGESVELNGWSFTVVEMEGRRIRRVRVVPHDHAQARAEASAD